MIILGIDPSYCATGIVLFDTETFKVLHHQTVEFNSLESLSDEEKELFKGKLPKCFFEKEVKQFKNGNLSKGKYNIVLTKNQREELTEYWNNIRLTELNKAIENLKAYYKWDVVVTENQVSKLSDVFAIARLSAVNADGITIFKPYRPSTWHKLLLGYGAVDRLQAKKIVKEKLSQYFKQLITQDEFDAMALILTYCKENSIFIFKPAFEKVINYMLIDMNTFVKKEKKKKIKNLTKAELKELGEDN